MGAPGSVDLVALGLPKKNLILTDRAGVVWKGRNEHMDEEKKLFAADTAHRTLKEAIKGADVFLGLSAPRVLDKAMVRSMADAPLIMALANPTPEIMPEEAREAKPDAVICTGRSDYTNQVNNALCFPFMFRGALDVGATGINEAMKLACVKAIADLTLEEPTAEVATLYGTEALQFGPEYLIPKPFDTRLIVKIPPAVAKAAMESGVATRPIEDFEAYTEKLTDYVFKSGQLMRPIFDLASANPKRVVFAEGEEIRVLHAVQTLVDEGVAKPILIGRESVITHRIKKLGLRIRKNTHFDLVNPESDPRYNDYWSTYHKLMERRGVTPAIAKQMVRTRNTVIAALMVYKDDADALICGTIGRHDHHFTNVTDILGHAPGLETYASLAVMIIDKGTFLLCDPFVNQNPTPEQLRDMALMAAEEAKMFGLTPKIALLSYSDFGSLERPDTVKMRDATKLIKESAPSLEVEGEMTASAALDENIRNLMFPNSELKGQANILLMPNIDAANITFHMMKTLSGGIAVGPLLLGTPKPAHILIPSVTSRGIVNAAAYASACVQMREKEEPRKPRYKKVTRLKSKRV